MKFRFCMLQQWLWTFLARFQAIFIVVGGVKQSSKFDEIWYLRSNSGLNKSTIPVHAGVMENLQNSLQYHSNMKMQAYKNLHTEISVKEAICIIATF